MIEFEGLILQFAGSLLAILALFGLAKWLGLGGKPKFHSEADVAKAADEVVSGFLPKRVSIARDGSAALARNGQGQIMLIKRHGNRFASRILTSSAQVREEVDGLVIDPKETQFGQVRLSLKDASTWADAINRL